MELRPLAARLPDPTLPFLILMFAGIRSEIGLLEKPDRIENRHRLTKLVGALMRPSLVSWSEKRAAAIGRKVSDIMAREGIDPILTPTVADRPRRADLLVGKGGYSRLPAEHAIDRLHSDVECRGPAGASRADGAGK